MPGELQQVIDVVCLVELPNQEAHQEATIVVVVLVLYVENVELVPLALSIELAVYPTTNQVAPCGYFLCFLWYAPSMFDLEDLCRVNHINLVESLFMIEVDQYKVPVAILLYVAK